METSLQGIRVLLVDDDDDTRELYELVLTQAGAEVHAAADGREALTALLEWAPTIVVSDLTLPGTDGIALLRDVRSIPHLRHVPAIAVSGKTLEEDRAQALAAGFQSVAAKPLSPDELVSIVKAWA